jgi:hypothetical protein
MYNRVSKKSYNLLLHNIIFNPTLMFVMFYSKNVF